MVCSVHEDKSIKILARSLSDTIINMSTVFNMAVIPDNLSICHKVIEAKVVGIFFVSYRMYKPSFSVGVPEWSPGEFPRCSQV